MTLETFFVQRAVVVGLTVGLTHGLVARTVRITIFVGLASDGDYKNKTINAKIHIKKLVFVTRSYFERIRFHCRQ